MAGKGSGLALLLGGGKPSAEPEGADVAEDGKGQATADAQAVIDAIQSGDAEGLVTAFAALKESCDAYESGDDMGDDAMLDA